MIAIINIVVGAQIAQRIGVGRGGSYTIGFVSGVIGTASIAILPYGFVLCFIVSWGLAWAIAKWARMGAKD